MARHMKSNDAASGKHRPQKFRTAEANVDDENSAFVDGERSGYSAGDEGTTIREGFTPIVGHDRSAKREGKKRKVSNYEELDPYNLKGDKKRRHPVARVFSTLLLIVGIGMIAAAGYLYFQAQSQYKQQEQVNAELAKYSVADKEDPNKPPTIDWASLESVNKDVVGWIYIPDTVVNYPVYQSTNNDRYLRHTATGEWSLGGQVFMDCQNTEPGMRDPQTIVYGHHLLDGSMFKTIADMASQADFDKHPIVWYIDENNQSYELQPLLVYKTNADDAEVRKTSFKSDEDFRSYLEGMLAKADASCSDASSIIGRTTHVLTLVTCNYDNGTGRTVLVCVPKDEAQPKN